MILPIEFGTPEYDEAIRLRQEILRKPLNMVFKEKDLEAEYNQYHAGYYSPNNVLLAVYTLIIGPESSKMRQVAVKEEYQRKGLGQKLVSDAEKVTREHKLNRLLLHARDTAVPFYEKNGYTIEGKEFKEVGIRHFLMAKKLL